MLCPSKKQVLHTYLLITATSLQWPLLSVTKVAIVESFDWVLLSTTVQCRSHEHNNNGKLEILPIFK